MTLEFLGEKNYGSFVRHGLKRETKRAETKTIEQGIVQPVFGEQIMTTALCSFLLW